MGHSSSRILITGVVSLLGKYLWLNLKNQHHVILTSRNSPTDNTFENSEVHLLDITNKNAVKQVIEKTKPDIIIHLASLSNIDYCESHNEEACQVNVEGTRNVCDTSPPHLIFISSSMVFHGNNAPYKETDEPNPVNVYGKTKTEAEKMVLQSKLPSTIIRFSTLFGYPPKNARDNDLSLYLKQLKQTKPLHLVNDRFYNPLSAKTATEIIKKIIDQRLTGIFHGGGQDRVNRYEFIKQLIQVFNLKNTPGLFSVPNDFYKHLAPRPIDVTLDTTKIKNDLKINPPSLTNELLDLNNS